MNQGYKINIKTEIKNLEEFERLKNEVKEFEKNNKIQLIGNINYNKMFSDLNLVQNHVDKLNNNKIKINLQNDNWNGTKQDIKEYRKYIKEVEQELKNEEVARNKINEAIEKTILQRNKESEALERNQANSINKNLDSNWKDIIKANDSINKSLKNTKEKFKNVINSNDLNKINKFEKELQSLSPTSQTLNKDIENLKTQIDNFNKSLSEKSKVQKFGERLSGFGKLNLESSVKDIEKFAKESVDAQAKVVKLGEVVEKNGHKIRQATLQWQDSSGLLRTNKLTLDDTTQSIYKSSDAFRQANDSHHGFVNSLKDMSQAALAFLGVQQLLQKGIQEIKESFSTFKDIDKAQTNVKLVTDMSNSQVHKFTEELDGLSDQLHTTLKDNMRAAEEFLRTGRSAKESAEMIKSSTVMSKIAGEDDKEAAEQLVAISNAYNVAAKDSLRIVDDLTTIDSNAATSTKELAQALSRTASSAKASGVTLEKVASWIGVVSSVSRKSAESIGESFKTIFARLNDIKQSADIDPYNEQLSQVEISLNRVGVALRKDKKTFRDMGDVINDVAKKWNTLDDIKKNDIAKSIAGTRQRENFLILMQHYNEALELERKQHEKSGESIKKYNRDQKDSIEGLMNNLENAKQRFQRKLISSDFAKNTIKELTKIMNKLSQMSLTIDGKTIKSVLGLGAAWLITFKNFNTISKLITSITLFNSTLLKSAKSIGIVDALALSFGRLGMSIKATTLALLKNPMTWFIAALGLATVAIARHIRKQKELEAQNKKVKESYDSLNEVMKKGTINSKDNKQEIDTLKQQKKALDEVINKRKALQKEMTRLQSSNRADRGALQRLNQVKNQLNGLDKEIHQVGSAFEKAGMHVDYMTGAVLELSQAELQCQANDMVSKIEEETQARMNNINSILDLIDQYTSLSQAENLNAEQKAELSNLAWQLAGKIDGLSLVTDEHGNTVIKNTELLGINKEALIKEKGELGANAEASKTNAVNRINHENDKTRAVIEQVQQRINAYKVEMENLQRVEAEMQKAGFLKRAWDTISGNKNDRENRIKTVDGRIKDNEKLLKSYEDTLKKGEDLANKIKNTPINLQTTRGFTPSNVSSGGGSSNDGGGYYPSEHGSGGGRKGKKSGSGSKGSKGKKEKSAEQQAKERLQKIKDEIDKKLKEYEDKVRLIDSRIKSLQDRKSLSEENSQDRASLQNQIELYMKQKIDVLKQKEAFIRSEMNKHKGTEIFKELNRQLLDTKDNISSLYTEISKAKETMIDDKYNAKLKNINKSIKDIKEQIDIIDSKDTFNKDKLNNMDKLIAKTKEQRNATSSFVQELEKQLKVSKDLATQSALRNSIKKYKEQLHDMNLEVNKLLVSKGQLIKDLTFEAEFIDKYSRRLEQLNNRLKDFEFNLNKIDISIESNKAKGDIHKAFESYEEYLNEMKRKELELKNQSMNLQRNMKDLSEEFSKSFGFDITRVNKEQLDNIYDELFKKQMVGSKEEKEALEKREELYKRLVDDYQQYTDAIQENSLSIGTIQNEINEKIKEQHDLMKEQLKSIQDQVKEMLKQEVEDEKKVYDEKLNRLKKFVDDSIKEREKLWKAEDYDKDLNKKINDKNKLKAEIAEKSRDNTEVGRNAVRKLKEQLSNLNEEIEKFQTQHNREAEKENLTDLLTQAEKETEDKKKELDKQLDEQRLNIESQEALINGFYTNSKGQIVKLQDSMVNFLEKTSDGLSFLGKQLKEELINNLEQANKLLNGYGSGLIQYNKDGISTQDIQSVLRQNNINLPQIQSSINSLEINKDNIEPNTPMYFKNLVNISGNCYDKGDLVDMIVKGVDNGLNKIKSDGIKRGYNPMLNMG